VNGLYEVVADVDQALMLVRVNSKQGATNATMFVNATGAIGTPTVAEGETATLEVPEELVPFRVGRPPVFFGGS
jgi:hypothetical protein